MTRTQRLQPVVKHTDKKQRQALLEVARFQGLLEQEQARLEQLKVYRSEYLNRKQQDNPVYSSMELQEFHRFIEQLDQTILQQQQVVELRRVEFERKQQSWKATRIDSKMMHKVVDNLQQQEFVEQERKDQKAQDEFSQRVRSRD